MQVNKKEKPIKFVCWSVYVGIILDASVEMYNQMMDNNPMTVPEIIHYITDPNHHLVELPKITGDQSPDPHKSPLTNKMTKSWILNGRLDDFIGMTIGLTDENNQLMGLSVRFLGEILAQFQNYKLTSVERKFIHAELVDPYLKMFPMLKREFIPHIEDDEKRTKTIKMLQADQIAIEIFSDAVLNNVSREEFLASFGMTADWKEEEVK